MGFSSGGGSSQTLTEHWDGVAWTVVPSPSPGSSFTSVRAVSATDVWAVGSFTNGSGDQTLIVHWNGTKWVRVPSPNPALGDDLTGVGATSGSSAWAVGFSIVGSAAKASDTFRALVLRWNGSTWTSAAVPNPDPGTSTVLNGVTATSTGNAWAVGVSESTAAEQGLILRWNGTAWKQVPAPSPGFLTTLTTLSAVAATSDSSAWAVGRFAPTVVGQALAIHCC